jgi:hypothetical protein
MSDSRQEIPQWTWYNGQFLFQFDEQLKQNPNKTISQFFQEYLEDQSLNDANIYHTKNQGTVIVLMYGLLVIPKEIWEKNNTRFPFTTRNKFITELPTDDNMDNAEFLRHLRNALSHANFTIDVENARLTFWDERSGKTNFKVEVGYGDLGDFLSEVGKYYINEVKNSKY